MDEKKKGFFKKYWGYIVSFIVGIGSALLYFFGISRKPRSTDGAFGNELEHLQSGLENTGHQVGDIRRENREASELTQQQRDTIREGREGHIRTEERSDEIGKTISDIRELIKKERERIENAENNE